jgi:hypothetical protein
MFVGCPALSYCPRSLLTGPDDRTDPDDAGEYRSPFRTWYERASVRRAPRRTLTDGDEDRLYFSPELVPVAGHPLVRELPDRVRREILIQHLYRYLDFTAKLEYLVVNRTVLGIVHGSVQVPVPEEMRLDGLKLYCDEAYHALFSADLARQVRLRTSVTPQLPAEPFFLRRLRELTRALPPGERTLAELLFVIVSETLISATLAEMPSDDDVSPAVRGTVRDHASDEGRHHAYFAAFLRHLWGGLDPAGRRAAGRLLPALMHAFLQPDVDAIRVELVGYGLSRDAAEQVLREVYAPEVVRAHSRAVSQQTRRYFEDLDAFEDPEALDQLAAYGFAD